MDHIEWSKMTIFGHFFILNCRRQEGKEREGKDSIFTCQTIEIGLKNGMSKVSILSFRGQINVFLHWGTLSRLDKCTIFFTFCIGVRFRAYFWLRICLQNYFFMTTRWSQGALIRPKMKSACSIQSNGFEKVLSTQGIPNPESWLRFQVVHRLQYTFVCICMHLYTFVCISMLFMRFHAFSCILLKCSTFFF